MKIEVWSDFACPFCYIGKRRLEEALKKIPYNDEIEVSFRSFELDPNAPVTMEEDLFDILAKKYGASREQAIQMTKNVEEQAKSVGLTFHFDKIVRTNTFDAHRLAHYANTCNIEEKMVERLFEAYFTNGEHLGDKDTLITIAMKSGLDKAKVQNIISNLDFADDVRANEEEARQLGVTGVPFFVINRKYAISGAQSVDVFMKAIEKAKEEEEARK